MTFTSTLWSRQGNRRFVEVGDRTSNQRSNSWLLPSRDLATTLQAPHSYPVLRTRYLLLCESASGRLCILDDPIYNHHHCLHRDGHFPQPLENLDRFGVRPVV